MRSSSLFFFVMAIAVSMTACNKFLDIQPEDKLLDTQVFQNEQAIQQTLNGVYEQMSSTELYGAALSSTTIEILAQRYNVATMHTLTAFQAYNYQDQRTQSAFQATWRKAYAAILQLNLLIQQLPKTTGILTEGKQHILTGEAYGLRAMLHLDLLRLFGPVYATADSLAAAIPYYTSPDALPMPLIPANAFMGKVIADLDSAAVLLKNDPVITAGIADSLLNTADDFYRYRNRRMNYFAVQAIKARACLYRDDKTGAYAAAREALVLGEKWFPWMDYRRIVGQTTNADRVFSPEVMFGLFNSRLYNNYNNAFNPSLNVLNILSALTTRLATTFELNENDYRYPTTWAAATGSYRVFRKYEDVSDATMKHRFFQPLVRKSELYFILAETEPDAALAAGYLNTVRFNRGLPNLPANAVLATEIRKEYMKEFFGEGQLFFYYKRLNITPIPSGISTGNIVMNKAKYVVPLPLSETELR